MARPVKKLSNMEIDEISLVDKGANQHAMIEIAKRAPEEETMPELYNEEGVLLNQDALAHGDIVYDAEGQAYVYEVADEVVEERELAGAGVSKAFETKPQATSDFSKSVLEELSKAFTDADRDAVIAKALGRVEELETAQNQALEIAKSERDLRLTREYIAKAAEYNLPVAPEDLGPVMYRMAETMSYEDCAVIAKCLESAGAAIFAERGYIGGGSNTDVMATVEAQAVEIGKSAAPEHITAVFDANASAYDEYLAQRRG